MKAVTWHGKRDVRVEQVPDPVIKEPNDAIVRITSTNICGSDLHLYEVLAAFLEPGDILGHEPMGVVEEVGPGGRRAHLARRPGGDPVQHLLRSLLDVRAAAVRPVRDHAEPGARARAPSLFGYTKLYGQVPGRPGRVPAGTAGPVRADQGARGTAGRPLPVPVRHPAHRLAGGPVRGHPAGRDRGRARARAGRPVRGCACARSWARNGCSAWTWCPSGWRWPERHGVETVDADRRERCARLRCCELTDGRGPDSVIDAVGMEAHGNPVAKSSGQEMAAPAARRPRREGGRAVRRWTGSRACSTRSRTVRRGGTVSVSGVYGGAIDPLPMMDMFDKGIQIRMGQCSRAALDRRDHAVPGRRRRPARHVRTWPATTCRWSRPPGATRSSRRRPTAAPRWFSSPAAPSRRYTQAGWARPARPDSPARSGRAGDVRGRPPGPVSGSRRPGRRRGRPPR